MVDGLILEEERRHQQVVAGERRLARASRQVIEPVRVGVERDVPVVSHSGCERRLVGVGGAQQVDDTRPNQSLLVVGAARETLFVQLGVDGIANGSLVVGSDIFVHLDSPLVKG